MQWARHGTPSRVSRITPRAAGGAKPLRHRGCPNLLIFRYVQHLMRESINNYYYNEEFVSFFSEFCQDNSSLSKRLPLVALGQLRWLSVGLLISAQAMISGWWAGAPQAQSPVVSGSLLSRESAYPMSGSLHGACFSLCLCLCLSLFRSVSLMNK